MRESVTARRENSEFWVKVDKTLRHHGNRTLRTVRGLWWDIMRFRPQRPVFIVGCSRAGTTLVYKVLSASSELGTLQRETHDFWASIHPLSERQWSSHALGADQASATDRDRVARYFFSLTGQRRFVDKNNQNGLCVPYLHALFPDACFVYVKRGPGDNINSLIEGWHRPKEFATWSNELPAEVAIDGGKYDHWCFFLAANWRDYRQAPLEEVCAFQYRSMNEAILKARAGVPSEQWIEIRYEDLLADPVTGFRHAFQACGLDFTKTMQARCLSVLKTPYNAFSAIRLDKWRDSPYRQRIEHVLPSVKEVAERMGYAGLDSRG